MGTDGPVARAGWRSAAGHARLHQPQGSTSTVPAPVGWPGYTQDPENIRDISIFLTRPWRILHVVCDAHVALAHSKAVPALAHRLRSRLALHYQILGSHGGCTNSCRQHDNQAVSACCALPAMTINKPSLKLGAAFSTRVHKRNV